VKDIPIILHGVKDHLIPHLSGKKSTRDMWEAMKGLFQRNNENHKMVMRENIRDKNKIGSYIVTIYLTRSRQVQDELATVGETVADSKLVRMALNRFTKEWTFFIKGIVAQEMILDWWRLWDEFIHEELRVEDLNGVWHKNDENIFFSSQENKGKFKKIASGKPTSQNDKKKDMRKFKFFACHRFGNYEG
jgi:hypothetical protein